MADQRMVQQGSVVLHVGPSFAGEIKLSKSSDPRLVFDQMLEAVDRSHIPSFIDRYLNDLGIGLVLTGEEMMPHRELVVHMINSTEDMIFEGEIWGRARLRMANVISLSLREVAKLPLEPADSFHLMHELVLMARAFLTRAKKQPNLTGIALGNEAMMEHWTGRSEEGLALLQVAFSGKPMDPVQAEMVLKTAQIRSDLGQKDRAWAAIDSVPEELRTERYLRLRQKMEGGA
jgi:hypothetical protein